MRDNFDCNISQDSEINSHDAVKQNEKINIGVSVAQEKTYSVHLLRELRQLVKECGEIPSDFSKAFDTTESFCLNSTKPW